MAANYLRVKDGANPGVIYEIDFSTISTYGDLYEALLEADFIKPRLTLNGLTVVEPNSNMDNVIPAHRRRQMLTSRDLVVSETDKVATPISRVTVAKPKSPSLDREIDDHRNLEARLKRELELERQRERDLERRRIDTDRKLLSQRELRRSIARENEVEALLEADIDQEQRRESALRTAIRYEQDREQADRKQIARIKEADLARRLRVEEDMRSQLENEEENEARLRRQLASHKQKEAQLRQKLDNEQLALLERRRRRFSNEISKERSKEAELSDAIRREESIETKLEHDRELMLANIDLIEEVMADLGKIGAKIDLLHDIEHEDMIKSREALRRDTRALVDVARRYRTKIPL